MNPVVLLVLEGRVPDGGQAALEEFLAEARAYYEANDGNRLALHWNRDDPCRFRETMSYASEAAYLADDERTRSDARMREVLERWRALLDGPPEVSVWRPATLSAPEAQRVVTATREIAASADTIFEFIADPTRQPQWDGNNNLSQAAPGQRVRAVGDVFVMHTTKGMVRDNHVVEFEEDRRIAGKPAESGGAPIGHLWRWELETLADGRTRVTHTYDWMNLHDERRFERAKSTTSERLLASIDRLARLAQSSC
ncbi:MAG: SRPBCC family protein [Tetrasphaera sp.]